LISPGYLNTIARQLNNRPRRCLDDETPSRSSHLKSITQQAVLHFKLETATSFQACNENRAAAQLLSFHSRQKSPAGLSSKAIPRLFERKLHCSFAVLILAPIGAALAGPPFTTDDPEPTPEDHFEIYLFSEGVHTRNGSQATLPGFELNYGPAPDWQLGFSVGQDYTALHGDSFTSRYGSTEFSAKYRFVHEDENGWRPQIAIFPSVDIPNGGGKYQTYLPIWMQKDMGGWEVFGGGGSKWNPEINGKNSWFAGVGALCPVSEHLKLGGEVFRQTAETTQDKSATSFNLASLYDINDTWHLVASAGRSLTAATQTNEFSYYLGLELTAP
jgi:hypothetical protein